LVVPGPYHSEMGLCLGVLEVVTCCFSKFTGLHRDHTDHRPVFPLWSHGLLGPIARPEGWAGGESEPGDRPSLASSVRLCKHPRALLLDLERLRKRPSRLGAHQGSCDGERIRSTLRALFTHLSSSSHHRVASEISRLRLHVLLSTLLVLVVSVADGGAMFTRQRLTRAAGSSEGSISSLTYFRLGFPRPDICLTLTNIAGQDPSFPFLLFSPI
jgi:hypothetical protein